MKLILWNSAGALVVLAFAAAWIFYAIPSAFGHDGCSRPPVLVSWYGKETCAGRPPGHGKGTCHTAADVPFDGSQWLVANKSLKFGTQVRFTYNGRSVTAPVLDRGPYVRGRTYDLSKAVARALGMVGSGVVKVCAEPLR